MSPAPAPRFQGTDRELIVRGGLAGASLGRLAVLCCPHCGPGREAEAEKGRWLQMRKGVAFTNVWGQRGFLRRELASLKGTYSREVWLHPSCLRA